MEISRASCITDPKEFKYKPRWWKKGKFTSGKNYLLLDLTGYLHRFVRSSRIKKKPFELRKFCWIGILLIFLFNECNNSEQIDSILPCVLFSNRSQMTLKCGKNKKNVTRGDSQVCHGIHLLSKCWQALKRSHRATDIKFYVPSTMPLSKWYAHAHYCDVITKSFTMANHCFEVRHSGHLAIWRYNFRLFPKIWQLSNGNYVAIVSGWELRWIKVR